ncbi:Arm DNA-binding domain-containing protein [Bernardetia litoralis]|uniref:Arm DNA-binding domain-containing protein n=1 Tax=Bernardetia litoralis TaxID=999 RepID=UPI00059EC79E|nr:Arm DNA-binding domain-containing protein [Bernardetia litoralis]
MANANIYIMDKEPDKKGFCKLMFFFSFKGKRFKMSTGEKCLPIHFDKKKQRVNQKHPFRVEVNIILDNLCVSAMSHYKMSVAKGIIPSVQELKEAIKPKTKEENNLENQV